MKQDSTILSAAFAILVLGFSFGVAQANDRAADLDVLFAKIKANASASQSEQIITAIQSSPALTKQIETLLAADQLNDILVVPDNLVEGTQFRAAITGTQIKLTSGILSDLKTDHPHQHILPNPASAIPDNTVFVLGQLAFHAQHDAIVAADTDATARSVFDHPNADGSFDATSALLSMQNSGMRNEAGAFLQGWNDMIDAAIQANHHPLAYEQIGQLLMDLRYRSYFIRAIQQKPDRIEISSDGHIEPNDKNLQNFVLALKQSPMADFQ